jgi:AcrR family transcriptional regulator
MAEPTGRREANKQATRAALRSAARQLFASQGFERTTVRDIARLANVTERTFYRYFDGKEDLVADDYQTFLAMLKDAILARPADEPALLAVQCAVRSLAQQAAISAVPGPLWLVSSATPAARLRRSTARPLVRLEDAIASALLSRPLPGSEADGDSGDSVASGGSTTSADSVTSGASTTSADSATSGTSTTSADSATSVGSSAPDDEFEARVISRICVAAMRSAIIELRGRLAAGGSAQHAASAPNDLEDLLGRAFAIVAAAGRELTSDAAP